MNTSSIPISLLAAVVFLVTRAAATEPVVSNMHASQVAGTKLVEVSYDISGGTPPYSVSVQGSADGGVNWTLPVTTVSGQVGSGVTAGLARKITWNAGQDWNGQYSSAVRFRLTALEATAVVDGFALIPAGSFQMGQDGIATPVHSVYVSAFYMAKYETTKELWDSVRAWGLTHGYTDLAVGNGSYASKGANHPVHSITWYDMVKWCNARSEKANLVPCYTVSGATYQTGQNSAVACNWSANGYRLPTEAEWEKAARGGVSGKLFPWGTDTITHSQANYYSNSSYAYDVSPTRGFHPTYAMGGLPYTSPVGSFAPNGYGLYDMAGNMWEWCHDWFSSSYYSSSPGSDPRGPSSGSVRVCRGGGWIAVADRCRAVHRSYADSSYYDMGFRVARSSVP